MGSKVRFFHILSIPAHLVHLYSGISPHPCLLPNCSLDEILVLAKRAQLLVKPEVRLPCSLSAFLHRQLAANTALACQQSSLGLHKPPKVTLIFTAFLHTLLFPSLHALES